MSSRRLQSPLHCSVPKPSSRPAPLWQIASALDPAAVRITEERREPSTSAITAGWICAGCGWLTAWFFPPAHVFFSVAIVLSVVALATHQVRAGLLLLAGSLAGIGVCASLFVVGVTAMVAGAFQAAASRPEIRSAPRPFAASTPAASNYLAPTTSVVYDSTPTAKVRPLTVDEVTGRLGAGQRDDQIIAATAGRPLLAWLGQTEITKLRVYGADERLIDDLRTRPVWENSPRPSADFAPPPAAPAMPLSQAVPASAAMPTPVDYQARDRQIENLKSQIDALDEQVRRIRVNPNDSRYRWRYDSSRFHGIDQAALDAYLKELDRQRNELRRQKWTLEGR